MILAPRYLPRLAATIGLFTRYGLKDFARQQGLLHLAPDEEAGEDGDGHEMAARAAAFRKRLVELGPAYVKLGQVLSTRPDLLPDVYIRELEHLQDDVGPIGFEEVEQTISEQLGGRISKLFDSFEEEPLGTASLGQVHGATLRDGRPVVVKVQRPNIRGQLSDDIEFFNELARFMTAHTEAGTRIDMLGVIQQLERALSEELDYRIEARNAATFRRQLAEFPHLLIPRVIEAYTSEKVLTSERIRGIKVSEVPKITRIEHDLRTLTDEFSKAYLKQITIDGHFHADPHPGNIFLVLPGWENPRTPSEVVASERRGTPREALTPLSQMEREAQNEAAPAPPDGQARLALIDFGMTARLSTSSKDQVVRLLLDIAENRGDQAGETLIEMGQTIDEFDRIGFVREVASIVARNHDRTIGEIHAGIVLYEMINTAYQRGLKLPAELTLLAKAVFNLDIVSKSLDPTYSPVSAIRDYANNILNERARQEFSPRRMFQLAMQTSDLINALPHRLDLISQRLATNDFGLRIDAPQLISLLKGLQKVANRIFTGLVICGMLIASAMLMPYRRNLGTTGFVIAAALGVYMILSILVSDRRRDG